MIAAGQELVWGVGATGQGAALGWTSKCGGQIGAEQAIRAREHAGMFQIQLLALHRHPNNPSLCLRALIKLSCSSGPLRTCSLRGEDNPDYGNYKMLAILSALQNENTCYF